MFKHRPTGPLVPRDQFERLNSAVLDMFKKVSEEGGDITIQYLLPSGNTAAFTFDGDPFKGKPTKQIDAAFVWELDEFCKREGL